MTVGIMESQVLNSASYKTKDMIQTGENELCINFGNIDECVNCGDMCNFLCNEYESKNTRRKMINNL